MENKNVLINSGEIALMENLTVKYKDVVITIAGEGGGILEGRTNDEMLMVAADILRMSTSESSLEDGLEIVDALRDTLVVDFGFTDIQVNDFIKKWRRNLYLLKIGEDNRSDDKLKDFRKVLGHIQEEKEPEIKPFNPISDGEIDVNVPPPQTETNINIKEEKKIDEKKGGKKK